MMSNHCLKKNSILNKLLFKNLYLITSLIISSCSLVAYQSSAHDVTVNITGTVTNTTCTVSPDSKDKIVDLGKVPANSLYRSGTSSSPVSFTINLENCGDVANGVVISFSGIPDSNMPDLLKLSPESSASGIAIELLDDSKELISIGGGSRQYNISSGQQTASLKFYAKMVANGEKIQTGPVISSVTFKTSYP